MYAPLMFNELNKIPRLSCRVHWPMPRLHSIRFPERAHVNK